MRFFILRHLRRLIQPASLHIYLAGGGMGNASWAVLIHLSPSSINITGMSSTIGYFRSQSLQTSHASLCNISNPSFSRTQLGHRKISSSSELTIYSPIFFYKRFYHLTLEFVSFADGPQIYVLGDRQSSFLLAAFLGSSVPGPYSQTAAHG
jgi:hypothetical protein